MSDSHAGWVASDLDGTLFSREWTSGAVVATWREVDGTLQPSSWIPARRHVLLSRLAQHFRVVCVTARDLASFSRVRVEGLSLRAGAVVANGAILLRPGDMSPDPAWDSEIAPQLAAWAEPLREMAARLRERSAGHATPRLVESHTPHPAYLVAKASGGFWSTDHGLEIRSEMEPFGCRIAEVGRELQVLPPPVSKQLGVAAFARVFCQGEPPLLALGDMPEDLGFLSEATFMAAPSESTLGRRWRDAS